MYSSTEQEDLRSHRRLDPLLIEVDLALQRWAPYGRGFYAARGFPVAARSSCPPRAEWPQPVVVIDDAVQRLHWALSAAVLAHYADRGEARAATYGDPLQCLDTTTTA